METHEMTAKPQNISVMIVNQHVLIRQMVSRILREENRVSKLYAMANEENDLTIMEIEKQSPDLLFLGLSSVYSKEIWLLKSVLNMYPEIPVVLLTPLTAEGARVAINGLKFGAVDYITTPDTGQGVVFAGRHFRKRITPLIKVLPNVNMQADLGNSILISQSRSVSVQHKSQQKAAIELVVLSGCMGGVHTLYDVLSALNDDFPVPVVIVQHMPKMYTRELANQLDLITPLNVREAEQNSLLLPGQVYVAPGGFHTIIKNRGRRKVINIHRGPREMKFRPSIDVLLRSAAEIYQERILGVFLSGGGKDGLGGAEKVLSAGGEIIVQNRRSSRLWDLPGTIQSMDSSIHQYHSHQLGIEIITRLIQENRSLGVGIYSNLSNQKTSSLNRTELSNKTI